MSDVQQEQQAEPTQKTGLRPAVYVSRPEQVLVYELDPNVSVDDAFTAVNPGDLRSPLYFYQPGQRVTHLLVYPRSRQVLATDHLHFLCLTMQLPQRDDGCLTCSQSHIESILDLAGVKTEFIDYNTVASIQIKGTGFRVQGESGCIDPLAYKPELGVQFATKAAKDKMFAHEGYAISRIAALAGVLGDPTLAYSFDGGNLYNLGTPASPLLTPGSYLVRNEEGKVVPGQVPERSQFQHITEISDLAALIIGLAPDGTSVDELVAELTKAQAKREAEGEAPEPALDEGTESDVGGDPDAGVVDHAADSEQKATHVVNAAGTLVEASVLKNAAYNGLVEQGIRELDRWEGHWNLAANRDVQNPGYSDLGSIPGVVLLGAHTYLLDRQMGDYLLEVNGRIQDVTGNTRMFFHVLVNGTKEVALLPKVVGVHAKLDGNGNLLIPEENLAMIEAVMP